MEETAIPLCLPNNQKWIPSTGEVRESQEVRSSLRVNEGAIERLRQIKGPVCVISIAGPCRLGKSYVLGKAFGHPDVFPLGHEFDSKTMGLWIWIVPQTFKDSSGREVTVVLLDSEGIGAVTAEDSKDNPIFTLTVLLASVLIYNSKEVPTRDDLNKLDFVAKLSQRIHIRSNSGCGITKYEKECFHKTFPFFIWLLRDVLKELPADCNGDIKQYFLTRVFKPSSSHREDQNQKVAKSVLRFFSGFDAFLLPPPSLDKEVMKKSSHDDSEMNPKFISEVEKFGALLKSKIAPKKSYNDGEFVTGEGFAAVVKLYVEAINANEIPNVQTAWETFVQTKCMEAMEKALETYKTRMTSYLYKHLPCAREDILKQHKLAFKESKSVFKAETIGITHGNTKRKSEELMEQTDRVLNDWKETNNKATKVFCDDLLQNLKRDHLIPVRDRISGNEGAKVSYNDIEDGCSIIKMEYNCHAKGAEDVRADVFFKFHERLCDEVQQYNEVLRQLKDYDENLAKTRVAKAYEEKKKREMEAEVAYRKQKQSELEVEIEDLEEKRMKEVQIFSHDRFALEEELKSKEEDMKKAGMEIDTLKDDLLEARESNRLWQTKLQQMKTQIQDMHEELEQAQKPGIVKLLEEFDLEDLLMRF